MLKLRAVFQLALFFCVCYATSDPAWSQPAPSGSLDLSGWDFDAQGPAELKTRWDFCWQALLKPGDECPDGWLSLAVPGFWSQLGLPREGYGTYRVHLTLPESTEPLALRVFGPYSAHRIWINGKEYPGAGVVTTSPTGAVSLRHNRIHTLPVAVRDVELIVQVANYAQRAGGLRRVWLVGNQSDIQTMETLRTIRDAAFMSVYLLTGLLFIVLFGIHRENRAWLYFGLLAISAGMRFLPTGYSDIGQVLLPDMDGITAVRMEYLANALVVFTVTSYFHAKLPGFVPRRPTQGVQVVSVLSMLAALLAPLTFLPAQLIAIQLTAPMMVVLGLTGQIRAYRAGVPHQGLTLFATSIGGIALIHDILRTQEILINQNQAEWLSPCLLLFVIIEAVVLLRMFYDSFTTIRDLSDELMESNEDLRETNVAIERFVPVEFLKQLNKVSIKDVHRGDHADARMNVLFADIRAFTQQIERKSSAEAFEYINAFLERMEIQIHSQGGFINQYFGDGIMALFDHNSDAAVAAAIGMQRALREHNRERAGRDAFETLMGVGINTGAVMLGTIGGEERLDSGVVGDPVNVAARIESLTRTYGAEILISGNVYERLFDPSRYQLRELDRVQLRGKSEVITIYEVLDGLDAEVLEKKLATLADFQEGRRLLAEGDRESARAAFEACLRIHPDDAAIAIYLERIEAAALV